MAIEYVQEIHRQRNATLTIEGSTYKRVFQVKTTNPADGPRLVATAPGIPAIFDTHPEDGEARCHNISADPDGDQQLFWVVTCDYRTATGTVEDPNPLNRPPDIDYDEQSRLVPQFTDRFGAFLKNTAGMPYDPPAQLESFDLVMRLSQNVENWSESWPRDYVGKVNSATWHGYPPRTCRIVRLNARSQYDPVWQGGFSYWTISIEIVYRAATWDEFRASIGFMELVDGVLKRVTDGKGDPIAEPVPLDQSGRRAPLPYIDQPQLLDQIDFGPLGLG